MKKPPISLIIGTATGLLFGSAIRYFSDDRPASEPAVADKAHPTLKNEPVQITIASRIDRPTHDEVLRLSGYNDAEILARYLEDTTINEIIALMDSVVREETSLSDMRWMIEMRGLELNHEAMLAWARSQKRDRYGFDDLDSLLNTWALMDPEAALREEFQEHSDITWHVASGMVDGDLDKAIAAIKAVDPDSPTLMEFENLRWAEMARTDAPAALKEVMEIKSFEERGKSLRSVIEIWAERDPLAAVQWIENQEDLDQPSALLSIGLRKLADTKPDLAWRKLNTLPLTVNRFHLESEIFSRWANQDSDAALALAKDLPAGHRRDHLLGSIGKTFEGKPENFFALMRELNIDMSNESTSDSHIKLEVTTTAHLDHSSETLSSTAREAAMELAKESPKEALIALHSLGMNNHNVNDVAEMWVESDPNAAAVWAAELPESEFATRVQRAVYSLWAKSPEATAASLVANGLSENVGLSSALVSHWVQEDAESAIDWASTLKGEGRDRVLSALASQWVRQDAESAIDWASTLKADVRDRVLSAALSGITYTDPEHALQHVHQIEDSRAQMNILERATQSWRLRDPEGVMTWLQSQPSEAAVDGIVMETAEDWVLAQPKSASEWIATMLPSPRKDQAVAGIVGALISPDNPIKDFDAAEAWAQTINDPELRQQRLAEVNELR